MEEDKCAFVSQPTANNILERERERERERAKTITICTRVFKHRSRKKGKIRYKNSCGVPGCFHK